MAANPGGDAEGVHSFEARLVRPEGVGTWTYFVIPLDLADLFGTKGTIQVRGTINSVSFRSAALPSGDGSHFVAVNKRRGRSSAPSRTPISASILSGSNPPGRRPPAGGASRPPLRRSPRANASNSGVAWTNTTAL